jgi:ribosome biogenesis GTPase A
MNVLDTPGINPSYEKSKESREMTAKHSQIGAITWDKTKNPDMVVFKIMKEYPGILEKYYQISAEGNSEILIESLGKRLHYLIKGGVVDEMRTAKKILKDWQEGKISIHPSVAEFG